MTTDEKLIDLHARPKWSSSRVIGIAGRLLQPHCVRVTIPFAFSPHFRPGRRHPASSRCA
jgi:hypothetical protein